MTPEEITAMAKEAGVLPSSPFVGVRPQDQMALVRFAELVAEKAAAQEREACARIAAGQWANVAEKLYGIECAAAIRDRGQKGGV
ncbi:hypothetical protein [Acidovorax sp.]|uniref:hypothetical protein n=1 Tax=Acidovorax sp. TaxID=1872122 RepID=UPI00391A0A28